MMIAGNIESKGAVLAGILAYRALERPTMRPARAVQAMNEGTGADWIYAMVRVRDHRDQQAFAELFRHFGPRVKSFLMRSGAADGLAEDCMQETMATLWRKAHLFDPSRASVSTWVFAIARNQRIDALRRGRRPEPEDLAWGPEADPDPDDVLAFQEEAGRLRRALSSLPEKQKALIEAAYFGDLSQSEISDKTGIPLGTVKSRIRLALDRLRHAMGTER